jgi:hypothetical protein
VVKATPSKKKGGYLSFVYDQVKKQMAGKQGGMVFLNAVPDYQYLMVTCFPLIISIADRTRHSCNREYGDQEEAETCIGHVSLRG